MKIITLATAAALAAGLAPAADAQTRTVTTRTVVHSESHTRPAFGTRHRTRQVCSVTYRHHQKVRSCRIVRT